MSIWWRENIYWPDNLVPTICNQLDEPIFAFAFYVGSFLLLNPWKSWPFSLSQSLFFLVSYLEYIGCSSMWWTFCSLLDMVKTFKWTLLDLVLNRSLLSFWELRKWVFVLSFLILLPINLSFLISFLFLYICHFICCTLTFLVYLIVNNNTSEH